MAAIIGHRVSESPVERENHLEDVMVAISRAARCEALFVSDLQPSQHAAPRVVRAAIKRSLADLGIASCAGRVAQEFGDHPEPSAARMRWARREVARAYPRVPHLGSFSCLTPT